MVVPEDHIRQVERLAQNMFICSPHASQLAALAAMDAHDELQENLNVSQEPRVNDGARLGQGLPNLRPPTGPFMCMWMCRTIPMTALPFQTDFGRGGRGPNTRVGF